MGKPGDVLKIAFFIDAESEEWDDCKAEVEIYPTEDEALAMVRRLVDIISALRAGESRVEKVVLQLAGCASMCGRLPPEATFTQTGEPLPDVYIADQVNGDPWENED